MLEWLESFLGVYGYLVVGLLVALESMGVPLPGETVLLAAAAYAGAGERLNVAGVIGCAAAGAIVGDTVGYWLGRFGGLPLLERYGRYIWLSRRKLARAQAYFERHGGKTVFFGRFVAFLRMFAALLAGVGRMPYGRFLTYNVLGGVCWAVVMGSLGYTLGRNLPLLERLMRWLGLGGAGVVLILVVASVLYRRLHRAKVAAALSQ
jgi:membrane protein DedA with SNARE-associated domain